MPAPRRVVASGPLMMASGPQMAPASTRPCPSRYLVPECTMRSAPSPPALQGGVQKQLSTASKAPWACAISAKAAMSHTLGQRVGGRFGKQQLGVGPNGIAPLLHIGLRYERGLNAKLAKLGGQQGDGGAKHALRAHDVIARLQQAHDQQQNGAHATGCGNGRFGASSAARRRSNIIVVGLVNRGKRTLLPRWQKRTAAVAASGG